MPTNKFIALSGKLASNETKTKILHNQISEFNFIDRINQQLTNLDTNNNNIAVPDLIKQKNVLQHMLKKSQTAINSFNTAHAKLEEQYQKLNSEVTELLKADPADTVGRELASNYNNSAELLVEIKTEINALDTALIDAQDKMHSWSSNWQQEAFDGKSAAKVDKLSSTTENLILRADKLHSAIAGCRVQYDKLSESTEINPESLGNLKQKFTMLRDSLEQAQEPLGEIINFNTRLKF